MRRPDVAKIRALRADDVADRLGLLEPNGAPGARGTRWRFRGYDGSHWVELHTDGQWTDHKHSEGGDAISLVQAAINGAPDFAVHQRDFLEACEQIAEAFGLWETIAETRAHSQRLANGEDRMVKLVEQWELEELGSDNWQECLKLLRALDVTGVTIAPDSAGTGALCWQPAVPWQGVRVSTKDNGRWGGWTRERAMRYLDAPDSLSIIALDFDGSKESAPGGPLKPSVALLDDMIRALTRRGLPPAAVVWSSPDPEQERSKAHIYWRCTRAASGEAEWKTWWDTCAEACAEIIGELEMSEAEAAALAHDPATKQITRLMRLPGFAKTGASVAGVVVRSGGDLVDLPSYLETRDTTVYVSGLGKIVLGRRCTRTYTKGYGDSAQEIVKPLAREVWPVAIYQDEDGSVGVQLRYHDRFGKTRYTLVPGDAWVSKQVATGATRALAQDSVQLSVGVEHDLIYAIGQWAQGYDRPRVRTLRSAGWHEDASVYLYGDLALGAPGFGPAPGIPARSVKGTLAGWQEDAAALVTTNGALTALATALAGALIKPLGRDCFGIHLHGKTSTGKTSALLIGASVWGGQCDSFNSTQKALEQRALVHSGASYVLDELGQAQLTREQLGSLVYNLINGQERGRLTKDAELRKRHTWSLSLLTTGEHSVDTTLGDTAMGGHLVRWLDVYLEEGEAARDAAHSEQLKRMVKRNHGVLGRAWVEHLLDADWEMIADEHAYHAERLREGVSSPEIGRALGHVALITLAMRLAQRAELLPWLDDARWFEWMTWLRGRIISSRTDVSCPEERAWARLQRAITINRSNYPSQDADVIVRELHGVLSREGDTLYTSRTHLALVCTPAGCSVNSFIEWLKQKKRTDGTIKRQRFFGRQLRWFEVSLNDDPPDEEQQAGFW